MAQINRVIGKDNYELVRDQIAGILNLELQNQVQLTYDMYMLAKIYIENINPVDQTYNPSVNVSFAGGSYDNKSQREVKGTYQYFIDCYAHGKDTPQQAGDYLAATRLHRMLRICRAILNDPIYKTLYFAPGFIWRTAIQNIDVRMMPGKNDAYNTFMGRLTFSVECTELAVGITPQLIAGWDTTWQVNNSPDGYTLSEDNGY